MKNCMNNVIKSTNITWQVNTEDVANMNLSKTLSFYSKHNKKKNTHMIQKPLARKNEKIQYIYMTFINLPPFVWRFERWTFKPSNNYVQFQKEWKLLKTVELYLYDIVKNLFVQCRAINCTYVKKSSTYEFILKLRRDSRGYCQSTNNKIADKYNNSEWNNILCVIISNK